MNRAASSAAHRTPSYRGGKRALLGKPSASQVAPAWRKDKMVANPPQNHVSSSDRPSGSKIMITNMPQDVTETEIVEFFKRIGPLTEAWIAYNNQSMSKGIAVVGFQREGDAYLARRDWNGKFIDGRRKIKIELVLDKDAPTLPKASIQQNSKTSNRPKSLLERVGEFQPVAKPPTKGKASQAAAQPATDTAATHMKARVRRKKGPRRVKKNVSQLDDEIDNYRAGSNRFRAAA